MKKQKRVHRKGVFVVSYYKKNNIKNKILYLLFHRKLHWKGWEFSKGGIKNNEKPEQAAVREVKEEAGQIPSNIKKYKIRGKFKYDKKTAHSRKKIGQSYILLSAQLKNKKIRIGSIEHDNYKFFPYKKALKLLTWQNQKKCLSIVNKSLTRKSKRKNKIIKSRIKIK